MLVAVSSKQSTHDSFRKIFVWFYTDCGGRLGFVCLRPTELLKVSCKHAACYISIRVSTCFQCVRKSRSLPLATINLVKNHPEMSDWVHPIHYTAPFYVSNNNYVKIAVDRVQAADQHMYNVLLLSTGTLYLAHFLVDFPLCLLSLLWTMG